MIKNLVYLDVDKMYSMSSQVFEGVTEYIVSERMHGADKTEDQKGPVGSGRVLGDILRQQETVSEKKILVDYSFSLFEKKLVDEDMVTSIDLNNSGVSLATLGLNSFIKARAKIVFNDMSSIRNTIVNFNKIGKALPNITTHSQLNAKRAQLQEMQAETLQCKRV